MANWTYYWSEEDLIERFTDYFDQQVNGFRDIKIKNKTESGRVLRLDFISDLGIYTLKRNQIKEFFHSDSLKFNLEKKFRENYLEYMKLKGSGVGNGLGLSLDGALDMAEWGKDYIEILNYYYKDINLKDLSAKKYEELKVEASIQWGLKYKEFRQITWSGQRVISLLDLDLERSDFKVDTFIAQKSIAGISDLKDIVKKRNALAGINGGFYNYTGRPLGLLITSNQIISESIKNRTALAITGDNEILINKINWSGILQSLNGNQNDEYKLKITGANRKPREDEIVVYNKFYGKKAPRIKPGLIEMVIKNDRIISISDKISNQETPIPEKGLIIQAHGKAVKEINNFKEGEEIEFQHQFNEPQWNEKEIIAAIGGGPNLLTEGRIDISGKQGEFQSDILQGRAPRSAVGTTDDNHLVFVTVDGRQPDLSIGITLDELASFMKDYGVREAMNLDGGGSARMVVRGYTMSNPSQKRLISNGILIFGY